MKSYENILKISNAYPTKRLIGEDLIGQQNGLDISPCVYCLSMFAVFSSFLDYEAIIMGQLLFFCQEKLFKFKKLVNLLTY